MARAYSLDLRKRVVEAIDAGLSTRQVARQFSIGISTSGAWYRAWRSSGRLEPGRQGKPKLSKLDAHETFILALVDTDERDITLAEIVEHLAVERGVKASLTTVHEFFAKRGITYKKRRRMRPNSSAQMFWQREKNGSKASSISIRAV
jgi:transposase